MGHLASADGRGGSLPARVRQIVWPSRETARVTHRNGAHETSLAPGTLSEARPRRNGTDATVDSSTCQCYPAVSEAIPIPLSGSAERSGLRIGSRKGEPMYDVVCPVCRSMIEIPARAVEVKGAHRYTKCWTWLRVVGSHPLRLEQGGGGPAVVSAAARTRRGAGGGMAD